MGGSESKSCQVWGKNNNIKANFLLGMPQYAGAPAGCHRRSFKWRPPKASICMYHVGLSPSLSNMGGWKLPQKLNYGGCLLLPPAPADTGIRGPGMQPR